MTIGSEDRLIRVPKLLTVDIGATRLRPWRRSDAALRVQASRDPEILKYKH